MKKSLIFDVIYVRLILFDAKYVALTCKLNSGFLSNMI